MTVFTNQKFIDHIIKSQGGHQHFQEDSCAVLQALVEFQTRKLIQTAAKFMRHQKKQTLSQQDIDCALIELGYQDLSLEVDSDTYLSTDGQCVRKDRLYGSSQEFFREEVKQLSNLVFQAPRMKGHWIYIGGKIPSTNDNVQLKSLSQLNSNKLHQNQQKKKLFNIIRDDPISLLTKEQLDYYRKIATMISSNNLPSKGFQVQGNVLNLMPFFLKLLARIELNQAAIQFFLRLIQNQYVWKSLSYHLKQVFAILMSYKGKFAMEVGIRIAEIVKRFSDKYPVLLDIYQDYQDASYSTLIKQIAFQVIAGVPFHISEQQLSQCQHQAEENDQMAILCLHALVTYSSQLRCLVDKVVKKEQTALYWHPLKEMKEDSYMNMF